MTLIITPDIINLIKRELATDIGEGDLSTRAFPEWIDRQAKADLVARVSGVLAGLPLVDIVWDCLGTSIASTKTAQDGDRLVAGQVLATFTGSASAILKGERTLLNLISHLSGIATLTAQYVAATVGTNAKILDTRKTLPGLRSLQKYAVTCGGGANHRMGLHDMVMLKDNHLALIGDDLTAAVQRIRADIRPDRKIEIEADSITLFRAAVEAGADIIMLDNMDDAAVAQCVKERPLGTLLEVSGGLTLERIPVLAEMGVDYLSVGRLTHSAPALDLALDFTPL